MMKMKKLLSMTLSMSLIAAMTTAVKAEGNTEPPQDGGNPPSGEKMDGERPDDMPGEKPEGEGGPGENGEMPQGGGANTQTFDYSGSYTGILVADGEEGNSSNETISATETDQNAALSQNGGTLTIDGDTLTKSGDDTNGDNCNFYGLNSIVLTVGENSITKIANSTLSADSEGSNAIFATDNGTVYAYNDVITTTSDNSRGLDATYSGTIIASDMEISTKGNHSATIATDRGGGNISVTDSSLNTAGSGSPLLYSTGNIEVSNVTGVASGSQIAGMEGLNTILIENSELSSTNNAISGSDPIKNGVIIYQSTSGDADTSTGSKALFQAVDSTLSTTIDSGAMFYVTNTTANIVLSNTVLDFDAENVNLLQIEGNDSNSWGSAGKNGATVTFTALNETLAGNISVDTISSLDFYLLDSSTYTGATSITQNTSNSETTSSTITMNISANAKWIVTGDSTVNNLNVMDGGEIVDENGNTVTVIANGETVISGTSEYTITVTGSYTTSFETSSDNEISSTKIDRTDFEETYANTTSVMTSVPTSETTSEPVEVTKTSNSATMYVAIGLVTVIIIAGIVLLSKKGK